MGIAKYYEDNMEIIDERMRNSNVDYYENTSINHYPSYPSKKQNFDNEAKKQNVGYILRNYECLDSKYKAIIPLKNVYIPTQIENTY